MLSINELVYRWDFSRDHFQLGPITLHCKRKNKIGLFGRSGLGKTTLLRLISGELTPTSGSVRLDVSKTIYHDQAQKIVPWLSARNNALVNLNGSAKVHDERVLRLCGVSDFENQDATRLSGGQRARVALARSLIEPCDILLLDEPFSGVDAVSQELLVDEISTIFDGELLIITSHDPGLLIQLCNSVLCLVRENKHIELKNWALPKEMHDLSPKERRNSANYVELIRELQGLLYG